MSEHLVLQTGVHHWIALILKKKIILWLCVHLFISKTFLFISETFNVHKSIVVLLECIFGWKKAASDNNIFEAKIITHDYEL